MWIFLFANFNDEAWCRVLLSENSGNLRRSPDQRVQINKTNMADVYVVLFTTLATLFLSLLFWKWINRRNQRIVEERTRIKTSRADMRKNRLKKFEEILDENGTEDESSEVTKTYPKETGGVLLAKDQPVFKNETPSNEAKLVGEMDDENSLQQDITSDVGASSGVEVLERKNSANETMVLAGENVEVLQTQTSVTKSRPKAENSRKWVSFSELTEFSLPETRPFTNLEELRAWNEGFDEFNISSTPLRRASNKLEAHPRTLVCHDMKGGYLEDR